MDVKAAMSMIAAAHADAIEKGLGEQPKLHGGASEMPCLVCGTGTLRYRVAGINGHMHAACTTEGCLRWME